MNKLATLALVAAVASAATIASAANVGPNNPAGDFVTNPTGVPANLIVPVGVSGWYYNNVRQTATIGINSTFPHGGDGSVYLNSTSGTGKADIEYYGSLAQPVLGTLGNLTSMKYDFYRSSASTVAGHLHASLRLIYDADGNVATTNDQGNLIFEEVYNQPAGYAVPTDAWQSADIFNFGGPGQQAKVWMTNFGNPNGSVEEVYDRTLNDWITTANPNPAYPTLSANSAIIGFSSGIGSGWTGIFTGAVDNIEFGFNGNTQTFNFDTTVPEPTSLVALGAASVLGLGRRRRA